MAHPLTSGPRPASGLQADPRVNPGAAPDPAAAPKGTGALSSAFTKSVRHNTIAEVVGQLVRAGGLVLLARALSPGDFGNFKILTVISVFAMIICQSGLPDALIQRENLTAEHEATGFWLTVVMALLVGGGLYAAAPLTARMMQMPHLREGLIIISGPMIIECISASPGARLRRRLNFRAIAIAEVAAEVAFLITALAVVWVLRLPRWSLSVGLAARLLAHGSFIWAADGYFPRQMPRRAALNDLRHFVVKVWMAAAVEVTSTNATVLLIGRILGSDALGYYSMAWDALRCIPDRLHRMAGRVTLPEFCRLQNSNERLCRAYLNFMSYVAKIVLPVLVCLAIAAPEVVRGVYGAKWAPTALPLRLLMPGMALVGLRMAIGSIYFAKNRPSFDILIHSGRLVLIVVAIAATARYGVAGVSAGVSSVECLTGLVGIYLACWLIDLKLMDFWRGLAPAFKLTLACAAATAAGKLLVIFLELKEAPALAILIVFPALAFWTLERQSLLKLIGYATPREALALD